MLRRSTSFETSPMPMKMAMNRPNTAIAASPRSLMILTSCPAVSCPSRNDEADQQDREEHQVVGHAVADRLAEHAERDPANRAHSDLLAWMRRARTGRRSRRRGGRRSPRAYRAAG